jgi:formate dehydrogenase subunit gamma
MPTDITLHTVQDIVDAKKSLPGALLPILHDIQDALGFVPPDAVATIAQGLNVSRAEVHGVITYYHHFRTAAAGSNVVQICRAEACQAMGSDALWQHACKHLGGVGTTADGSVTLEATYCLGLCASSPAISVNNKPYARVSAEKLTGLLDAARGVV